MDMSADAPALAMIERRDDAAACAAGGEYLSFRVGAEHYGIGILQVQEIRSHERPTRIAGAPPQVLGVIDLRGAIVPIVDLRCLLGETSAQTGDPGVVVVLNLAGGTVGIAVDAVSDVSEITAAQIRPAPAFAEGARRRCITGIGCVPRHGEERLLVLLDMPGLLAGTAMP